MKRFILALTILLISPTLGLSKPAHAQSVGLSISPPVVEVLLSPNKKVVQTFNLKNQGESIKIIPSLHLVTPSDAQGHVTINPSPLSPTDIPLVATLTPHPLGQPLNLDAGSNISFNLTLEGVNVDSPTDAYLAFVVSIESSPDLTTASSFSTTSPGISALILTTLTPTAIIPASLEIQNFDPPLYHDSYLPLTLHPLLKNSSSIMLRPKGSFEVINSRGQTAYQTELYPNLILGNSTRSLESSSDNLPKTITWTPTWKDLGPHVLRLKIQTEGGTILVQSEKTIWILPLRALIGIIVLVLIMFILIRSRKSLKLPLTSSPNHD